VLSNELSYVGYHMLTWLSDALATHVRTRVSQGVYLCEHRDIGGFGSGHAREVTATVHTAPLATQTSITVQVPPRTRNRALSVSGL